MFANIDSDDHAIHQAVTNLAVSHRVAFAAACAERLLPAYEAFARAEGWGAPQLLREGLDAAWAVALTTAKVPLPVSELQIRALCEGVLRVTPDPSGGSMDLRALAIGAAACTVCALRACHVESVESAVLSAMTARETVLLAALGTEGFEEDDDHHVAVVEARTLREIVQQGRDLEALAASRKMTRALVTELKASATRVYIVAPLVPTPMPSSTTVGAPT